MKQNIAVGLFVVSLALLVPGLVCPMLTIHANIDRSDIMDLGVRSVIGPTDPSSLAGSMIQSLVDSIDVEGTLELYNKTRSVLGTINDLVASGYATVAILIGLFAVVVPVTKSLLLLAAGAARSPAKTRGLQQASQRISKWSMVDVFVIAIIVSYLALNASAGSGTALKLSAQLGIGFYCFAGYCLLSNLSAQLIDTSLENAA